MKKRFRISFIFLVLALFFVSGAAFARVPRIGVIYSNFQAEKLQEGEDYFDDFRRIVELTGGRVVSLCQNQDPDYLKEQLSQIDGLIIPGGWDIDPKLYGEEPDKSVKPGEPGFDEFEIKIIMYAMGKKLPILGICRGHQLMNVYLGGSLYQDIPSQFPSDIKILHRNEVRKRNLPCFHYINIEKGSLLGRLLNKDRMRVNSIHHQAIKKLAPGLKVTARTDDGLIEAVESIGEPFYMGLQFHPERNRLEDPRFESIFYYFMGRVKKNMKKEPARVKK